MIPVENVILISILTTFIGLVIGMILFDPFRHDFEDEYDTTCTKSKHFFPLIGQNAGITYCFCGSEAINNDDVHKYLIIKS